MDKLTQLLAYSIANAKRDVLLIPISQLLQASPLPDSVKSRVRVDMYSLLQVILKVTHDKAFMQTYTDGKLWVAAEYDCHVVFFNTGHTDEDAFYESIDNAVARLPLI